MVTHMTPTDIRPETRPPARIATTITMDADMDMRSWLEKVEAEFGVLE
jgi:hypothetical protein